MLKKMAGALWTELNDTTRIYFIVFKVKDFLKNCLVGCLIGRTEMFAEQQASIYVFLS